LGH
jgi:hypothetical protein